MTTFNKLCVFCLSLTFIGCDREKSNSRSSTKSEKPRDPISSAKLSEPPPQPAKPSSFDSDLDRPVVRGPKQKYAELVIQPEQPNPIKDRLNKAIKDADGDITKLSENFTKLWSDGIVRLSNTALSSSKVAEVSSGIKLPKEIEMVPKESRPSTGKDTAEELLRGVAIWSALMRNNLLTEFANQRANSLPPTTVDLAIYEALNAGIGEFTTTRGQSSYASFEKWEPFANAANPVYRLLALKAASLAVSKPAWEVDIDSKEFNRINERPKLDFYLSYLDEEDPIILSKAIRSLSFVPLPEAREAIEKFHAKQLQKGDPVVIQAAEEALRTQENISP